MNDRGLTKGSETMSEQMTLAGFRPIPAATTREAEIDAKARRFVSENPTVWALFVRFTMELIHAGREHYSSDAVVHRIRWYTSVETTGDEFKISNSYTAVFARWFHEAYPEHAGFFRTRTRPSSRQIATGRS